MEKKRPAKKKSVKKTVRKNEVKKKPLLPSKPKQVEDTQEVNYEKLAKDHGLTEMQTKFAYYYVFVTGLNGPMAVELAGYSCGNYDGYDEKVREYYTTAIRKQQAKGLLDNPKVLTLITSLREEMSKQIIVDQLYVIQNLKRLAETAPESVQLRALEKIGETMEMFGQKTIIDDRTDPARVAAEAFEKRRAEMKVFPKAEGGEE